MTIKVLAVDDSRTMRALLVSSLSREGFDVSLAEDGLEGLAEIETVSPDVIITDINMPNVDGIGFIERARKTRKAQTIPILVLTTESDTALKERARDAGATGWIVKPFDKDKLVDAIRRVTA